MKNLIVNVVVLALLGYGAFLLLSQGSVSCKNPVFIGNDIVFIPNANGTIQPLVIPKYSCDNEKTS